MSTPIFKAAVILSAVLLAGCEGGIGELEGFNVTRSAPERIELPDGLVVSGTRGWCVDTRTTRVAGETSVVVLGSCAAIARNAFAPRPDVPGVVTVSVESEGGDVPPVDVLQNFLFSAPGRAALARDGSAQSVQILESRRDDDLLLVHVEDRSIRPVTGAASDYWRALFDFEGRFVTVSLTGMSASPIGAPEGFETLVAQVDRIRASNTR
ncbi:MAG: hypothetical protein KJO42_13310 [Silicimonas sp.]|nr:hypothetical protein [Silicimonas sp.]